MAKINDSPTCNKMDCAAYEDGMCVCLIDTNFKKKECPFFKTTQQCAEEEANRRERLEQIAINKKEK